MLQPTDTFTFDKYLEAHDSSPLASGAPVCIITVPLLDYYQMVGEATPFGDPAYKGMVQPDENQRFEMTKGGKKELEREIRQDLLNIRIEKFLRGAWPMTMIPLNFRPGEGEITFHRQQHKVSLSGIARIPDGMTRTLVLKKVTQLALANELIHGLNPREFMITIGCYSLSKAGEGLYFDGFNDVRVPISHTQRAQVAPSTSGGEAILEFVRTSPSLINPAPHGNLENFKDRVTHWSASLCPLSVLTAPTRLEGKQRRPSGEWWGKLIDTLTPLAFEDRQRERRKVTGFLVEAWEHLATRFPDFGVVSVSRRQACRDNTWVGQSYMMYAIMELMAAMYVKGLPAQTITRIPVVTSDGVPYFSLDNPLWKHLKTTYTAPQSPDKPRPARSAGTRKILTRELIRQVEGTSAGLPKEFAAAS